MRKLLSALLILLLPVQGMFGSVMAMQMDFVRPLNAIHSIADHGHSVDVSAHMDCEMMGAVTMQQDADHADGCDPCADCPLCHLVAANLRWPQVTPAQAWATPLFMPQALAALVPLPGFKPPIS